MNGRVSFACAGPGCATHITVRVDQFDKFGEGWLCDACRDKAHTDAMLEQLDDMARADAIYRALHGKPKYLNGDDY